MIPSIRQHYNSTFSPERYQRFIGEMNRHFDYEIPFKVSESPVFIPRSLKEELLQAGEHIIDYLVSAQFRIDSQNAIPGGFEVPDQDQHSSLLALDFALCSTPDGRVSPRLIELQGFASLYGYQEWLSEQYRHHFLIPDTLNNRFGGLNHEQYIQTLRECIVGNARPENVILLEIEPLKQKTAIDFLCTREYLGIEPVCVSHLIHRGRNLYYRKEGREIRVERIYNRVIFDEWQQRPDMHAGFDFFREYDVQWVAHPNWFFKISKYTLPFLKNPWVPETYFVDKLKAIPDDLENWVLKPLFSFSGQGVVFDVALSDLQQLKNPENYILQRKVQYAEAIEAPEAKVKAEIRLMYLWPEQSPRPVPVINLSRMSRGKMIGVRYNSGFDWVGGTTAFLED